MNKGCRQVHSRLPAMAKKRRKERAVRLMRCPDKAEPGAFAIVEGRKITYYAFREIACHIGGRGFLVHRLDEERLYHVRIGSARESTCECLGFCRHAQCKHVQALQALVGQGLLG